jgi:hypothetical protein
MNIAQWWPIIPLSAGIILGIVCLWVERNGSPL